MKKKRIAVIHNLTRGGAVTVLNELNNRLNEEYQVDIYHPGKYKFGNIFSYLKYLYWDLPKSYLDISNKVDAERYEAVIHHHDAFLKAPLSLLFIKSKSIYFLHEPPREFYEPIDLHAPLIKDKLVNVVRLPVMVLDWLATRRAKVVIANSYFSKNRIRDIYKVKAKVIYLGVAEKFLFHKTINRTDSCVSVGSLLPYKGNDLVIKAVDKSALRPQVIIVGGGRLSEKKKIRSLTQNTTVRVTIKNSVSDDELSDIYRGSKLYVNAAYMEPFGLSALEAVISGAMLVTVDNCGTTELKRYFPDRVIVTGRNVDDLSKGINRGLSKFVEKEIKTPTEFMWDTTVRKLIKIINAP